MRNDADWSRRQTTWPLAFRRLPHQSLNRQCGKMHTRSAEKLSNGGRFRFFDHESTLSHRIIALTNNAQIFYRIIQRYRLHIRKLYLFYSYIVNVQRWPILIDWAVFYVPGLYSENAAISMICTVAWPSHMGVRCNCTQAYRSPRKRHLGILDNNFYQ